MVNKINAIQTLQNVRNELGSYDTNREARKQEIYDLTGQYQNMTEAYKSNLFAQWEEQETDRLSALVEKTHRSALDELKATADTAMKNRQKVIGEAGYLNDYTMLVTTTDKTRPYMAISQVFRKYTELFGVTPEEFTATYGKTISPYFGNIMG